jgi:hypothetical protein
MADKVRDGDFHRISTKFEMKTLLTELQLKAKANARTDLSVYQVDVILRYSSILESWFG